MCNQAEAINHYTMAFQLNEASESIHSILMDIERGEDADAAMWVSLADILGHLCLAWHRRRMGPDRVMKENQEEYEQRAVSIPNWGNSFQLVELAASHPAIAHCMSRRRINQDTVCRYLRAAESELQHLMGKIESGECDSGDISVLGSRFGPILHNLCLAWHLRYLNSVEVCSLAPTAIQEIGCWLPKWQWNLCLIPLDQEVTETAVK
jgi:hypothetical protein